MKLLVTGGEGAMARALRQHFPHASYMPRHRLDVRNREECERTILREQPTHILHAAAITDHQCPDVGLLIETNIIGTQNIVMAAEQVEAKVIYLSTHYVYPGTRGNYTERDACLPIGNYAWAKYAGELAVDAHNCDTLVIRGSWYTREKLEKFHGTGALVDAYTNREAIEYAAEKIAALIRLDPTGTFNIGGERKSFLNLMKDEGFSSVAISRAQLNAMLPYPFPEDSSVNVDKFRALVA